MIDREKKLALQEDVFVLKKDGKVVIVTSLDDSYFELEGLCSQIPDFLNGKYSFRDILTALSESLNEDPESIEESLEEILTNLMENNIACYV